MHNAVLTTQLCRCHAAQDPLAATLRHGAVALLSISPLVVTSVCAAGWVVPTQSVPIASFCLQAAPSCACQLLPFVCKLQLTVKCVVQLLSWGRFCSDNMGKHRVLNKQACRGSVIHHTGTQMSVTTHIHTSENLLGS